MLHVNIYNFLNGYRAQSLTSIRDHTFHIQGHCRVVEQGQPVFGALFSLQQVQFACFHIRSCRSESQSATLCDHQLSFPNCLHLCHSSSYLSCRHPYTAAWDVPEIWCPRQVGHIAGFWAHSPCPCGVCVTQPSHATLREQCKYAGHLGASQNFTVRYFVLPFQTQ